MLTVLCKLCAKQTTCEQSFGAIWAFLLVAGFLATTTSAVIHVIQYQQTPQHQVKKEYVILITIIPLLGYLLLIFILTVLGLQNLSFWFERMLYFDDILVQDIDEEEERRRNIEKRLKTMQFQRPWLIKRLTNTYYRKSKQDFVHFQQKVKKLRRQFQSRANRMSVNLEQIMYKKKGKDPFLSNQSQLQEETATNLMQDQSRVHLNAGNFNSEKVQTRDYKKGNKSHRVVIPFSPMSTSPIRFHHNKEQSVQSGVLPSPGTKEAQGPIFLQSERMQSPKRIKKYGELSIESDPRNGLPIGLDADHKNCLICFNSSADAVLLKCGHGGICYDCGCQLLKSTQACHLCRNSFNQVLQLDLNKTAFNYINVVAMTYLQDEQGNDQAEKEPQPSLNQEQKSSFIREQIQTESDQRRELQNQKQCQSILQQEIKYSFDEKKKQQQMSQSIKLGTRELLNREEVQIAQLKQKPLGQSSQFYLTPLDLVSYRSQAGERNYESYLEQTFRSRKKSIDKKILLDSQFTTEQQMIDAIREAQPPITPEIMPMFRSDVARNETPYYSNKFPRQNKKKLRVMSIVLKNQDTSGLTSLSMTQRASPMQSHSGEVVWDSTEKKLYLASLGPQLASDKEYQSAMSYNKIKQEDEGNMLSQEYQSKMIRVEEHEYEHDNEASLNEQIGNKRIHNLRGMLRQINKEDE